MRSFKVITVTSSLLGLNLGNNSVPKREGGNISSHLLQNYVCITNYTKKLRNTQVTFNKTLTHTHTRRSLKILHIKSITLIKNTSQLNSESSGYAKCKETVQEVLFSKSKHSDLSRQDLHERLRVLRTFQIKV